MALSPPINMKVRLQGFFCASFLYFTPAIMLLHAFYIRSSHAILTQRRNKYATGERLLQPFSCLYCPSGTIVKNPPPLCGWFLVVSLFVMCRKFIIFGIIVNTFLEKSEEVDRRGQSEHFSSQWSLCSYFTSRTRSLPGVKVLYFAP